ncbi:MAG: (d)CMP kinase [Planctomycetes bacterium]|nr:(d)CMP kinase [Planctomycetota bacterium]
MAAKATPWRSPCRCSTCPAPEGSLARSGRPIFLIRQPAPSDRTIHSSPLVRAQGPTPDLRHRRGPAAIFANLDRFPLSPSADRTRSVLSAFVNPSPTEQPASGSPSPIDVVAIDGPSGAGKSTVARRLAQRLGFAFLDTGAMYRAITWRFLERGCAPAECAGDADHGVQRMQEVLARTALSLRSGRVYVDDHDVTAHLRTREVESQVSAVSALAFVRGAMRDLQRRIAAAGPTVAEGRDMGSVVFPHARWKFYLDAAPSERARRRSQDFVRQGRDVAEVEVLEEILVRDRLDSTRQDAPLRQAADAAYVDTTGLTFDAVVDRLFAAVRGSEQREPGEPGDGGVERSSRVAP